MGWIKKWLDTYIDNRISDLQKRISDLELKLIELKPQEIETPADKFRGANGLLSTAYVKKSSKKEGE